MSKEIFYLYFKNKDELFIECADQIFRNMYNHVWQHIKAESDMLKRLWKRRQAFFDSYQQWIVMMDLVRSLSVSVNPVFKKKLFQLLRQMINPMIREIEQLRQEGRIRKDLDSAVAGYVFMGIAEYGASLINRKMYSRKKVTEYIDKILQHGVMG
jgi:AcrR family transcriptional regulator